MTYKILTITLFASIMMGHAQSANDTINQTDKKGQKQGYWQKKYPNGKFAYQGFFKDDQPTGPMTRYFESGAKKAELIFSENGKNATVTLFYENENKAAEGFYVDGKKDSLWNYYSYYDQTKKMSENYTNGKKDGKTFLYFMNGQIFEETNWENGVQVGEWRQYFQSGELEMISYYENGVQHGCFNVFFEDGEPRIVGRYENNQRHGPWLYYDEEGNQSLSLEYNMGKLLNEEALNKRDQEFFDEMEKNIGNIKEPELEDFVGF